MPETKEQWDRDIRLRKCARVLAMLSIQSDRYANDPEFRDATDAVLELSETQSRNADALPVLDKPSRDLTVRED